MGLVTAIAAFESWGFSEHSIRRKLQLFHTRSITDLGGVRIALPNDEKPPPKPNQEL